MTKIVSRIQEDPIHEVKMEMAHQVADELDYLVDKLDEFLEMRIRFEFEELRDDIQKIIAVNDALMTENMQLAATCAKLQEELFQKE